MRSGLRPRTGTLRLRTACPLLAPCEAAHRAAPYSKRLCLRNQPLETQHWIWAQIVRNQPQVLGFATQEPLRILRNWLAGSEAQFLTRSLLLVCFLEGSSSQGRKEICAHPLIKTSPGGFQQRFVMFASIPTVSMCLGTWSFGRDVATW